jgi:hypothetical protein
MAQSDRLRELATWYREFADKAGTPAIWELRMLTAEDLEREAAAIYNRIQSHDGAVERPSVRRN